MTRDEYTFKIQQARDKYKPAKINCLFIAEAPPKNDSRFFYYEDVKQYDDLFLGIMGVLYPDDKELYILNRRATGLKEQMLNRFKSDGFLLIDLLDFPKEPGADFKAAVPRLIDKASALIDHETPVILIKVNVFDVAASALKRSGFNVIDERICFPGSGRQKEFALKFVKALDKANLR